MDKVNEIWDQVQLETSKVVADLASKWDQAKFDEQIQQYKLLAEQHVKQLQEFATQNPETAAAGAIGSTIFCILLAWFTFAGSKHVSKSTVVEAEDKIALATEQQVEQQPKSELHSECIAEVESNQIEVPEEQSEEIFQDVVETNSNATPEEFQLCNTEEDEESESSENSSPVEGNHCCESFEDATKVEDILNPASDSEDSYSVEDQVNEEDRSPNPTNEGLIIDENPSMLESLSEKGSESPVSKDSFESEGEVTDSLEMFAESPLDLGMSARKRRQSRKSLASTCSVDSLGTRRSTRQRRAPQLFDPSTAH